MFYKIQNKNIYLKDHVTLKIDELFDEQKVQKKNLYLKSVTFTFSQYVICLCLCLFPGW